MRRKLKMVESKRKIPPPNAQASGNSECELIIGLDFGTSSTKVVIQAPDFSGGHSFAVDFGHLAHPSMSNLLPTKLWVWQEDGEGVDSCSLKERAGAKVVGNIKPELVLEDKYLVSSIGPRQRGFSPEEIATVYLALVLQYSKEWFYRTKGDIFGHFQKFIWSLNLGIPSSCTDDNKENRLFRQIMKAAWLLSKLPREDINLKKARWKLERVGSPNFWGSRTEDAGDFNIIPEIAAGAVGYALSNLFRKGLHLMVDIGASTVDVCSFNLQQKDGEKRYSFLMTGVKNYGVFGFYRSRLIALMDTYEGYLQGLLDKHDPMKPVDFSETVEPYIIPFKTLDARFMKAKTEFREKKLLRMIRGIICETKVRRAAKASVWGRYGRLPILLIGGGSQLPFFRSVVEGLGDWLRELDWNTGIQLLDAPLPDSLIHSARGKDGQHFLTVAWGLSHRALDVGEIIPMELVPDDPLPQPPDVRSRYVGKEQV